MELVEYLIEQCIGIMIQIDVAILLLFTVIGNVNKATEDDLCLNSMIVPLLTWILDLNWNKQAMLVTGIQLRSDVKSSAVSA